ncbi:MAG: WbqC family protein [Candidatus Omnitrophica bacterium]|nr:WbqC family protein [Candidatus Omnitrophota bacterium]
MNVAMMQPAFMPWQGYFELISKADIFIFLDDFQFSVQSYHQRNRLFVNKGEAGWYTVPILKAESFGAPLNKAKTNDLIPWREKLWKRLEMNYSGTPFFKDISPEIKSWLFSSYGSLAEQNIAFIKIVCAMLGLQPQFRCSSEYQTIEKRSKRVTELLNWCKATHYFCAKGSFEYMLNDKIFPLGSIEVFFQDFVPREYPQTSSRQGFIPCLSVLDALFNAGAQKTAEMAGSGTKNWLTWQEMKAMYSSHASTQNKIEGQDEE